jgi:hypothetical protein
MIMKTILATALAAAVLGGLSMTANAAPKRDSANEGGPCYAEKWTEWSTTRPIWVCPGDRDYKKDYFQKQQ